MSSLGRDVLDDLVAHGDLFDFFQAVRLIQLEVPDKERVGADGLPSREHLRFEPHLTLSFAGSPIHHVEAPDPARKSHAGWKVVVSFIGTHGTQGTLPRHYTDLLMSRARAGDHGLRAFLDMFNHRFISLFFRANEKYRTGVACRVSGDDAISNMLFSLMGLAAGSGREAAGLVPRRHLLRYSGLWTQKPRSLKTVEALVTDYFPEHHVVVRQFLGRWVYLPEDAQGRVLDGAGANQLGENVVVGRRVHDHSGNFRLRVGPLGLDDYLAFQPGGEKLAALTSLVREFVGDQLWFDVQPVLRAKEIPPLHLSRGAEPAPRLGRTTWLTSKPRVEDGDEPTFHAAA